MDTKYEDLRAEILGAGCITDSDQNGLCFYCGADDIKGSIDHDSGCLFVRLAKEMVYAHNS